MRVLALLLLALPFAFASLDVCYPHDSDCPPCPANKTENWTTFIYLTPHVTLSAALLAGEGVISAIDKPDVLTLQSPATLHTTLNYFCCYSKQERKTITNTLKNFAWNARNLTYNVFGCNLDHDNATIYLHAQPDAKSQDSLFSFIRSTETAIQSVGIPINTPRVQPFHATLATVNYKYPVDKVVQLLNGRSWGSFTFDYFLMTGELSIFHARG